MIMPAQFEILLRRNRLQILQPDRPRNRRIARPLMHRQPRRHQFHRHRKSAQPLHDAPRRLALPGIRERTVLLQQFHRIRFGKLAQRQPVPPGGRSQPRRQQHMQLRPQRGQFVGLLRARQRHAGHVVEHQQDAPLLLQPPRQASVNGGEESVGSLAFLIRDGVAEIGEIPQRQRGLAHRSLAVARYQQASAGVNARESVGIRERQLGFADATQPVQPAHHSGMVALQTRAQVEQFVHAPRELLVVRRDCVRAFGGAPHAVGALVDILCEPREDAAQIFPPKRVAPFVIKPVDLNKLAAAQLFQHRRGVR
jgi:hypothetical protein